MGDTFVGHASVTINASRARVWDALVNPEVIERYMPVSSVVSEWRENSPIVWKSEFQGKPFEVRGMVLRFEAERVLEYSHSLPIFRSSGAAHSSEDYQRVTLELRDEDGQTHVSVTAQGNRNRKELEHSEGSWRMVLHGMKALLEGRLVVPMRSGERS
jgi:uncharacterized protein YndB with AHSA1/START domain